MQKSQKIILWTVLALFLGLVVALILTFDSILASMASFLIKGEEPRKADAIIVLSGGKERVPYAAELYRSGYAGTVILSGGGRYMTQMALDAGIPSSSIIRENQSGTTFENARYSLMIVKDQGYKSVLVVTSPYHTRRAGIIFHHFFQDIDVTICAVPYDPAMTRSWWKQEDSARFVITEYLKMVWHYLVERT